MRDLHMPILRELDEPREGYESLPMWLVFLFFALLGWGGWYLGAYNGQWSALQYNEIAGAARGQEEKLDPKALGKRVFNNCVSCHQVNAQGLPGQYPPLAGSEWVLGPPETMARILLHGLSGPVTVAGKPYDNQMPAWAATLTDEQVAGVMTYARSEFGNKASAVDAALAKKIRAETKARSTPWTSEELKALEKRK
jgi:mono/diheme cytochrome c family protein